MAILDINYQVSFYLQVTIGFKYNVFDMYITYYIQVIYNIYDMIDM